MKVGLGLSGVVQGVLYKQKKVDGERERVSGAEESKGRDDAAGAETVSFPRHLPSPPSALSLSGFPPSSVSSSPVDRCRRSAAAVRRCGSSFAYKPAAGPSCTFLHSNS